MTKPMILSPAGSWEALRAAIQSGADAVYFGMGALNMRTHSGHNFSLEELPQIVETCESQGVESYVTVNSIIYNEDLALMKETLLAIKESGASAVIASDLAVIQYARSIDLPVHISTQLNVCNLESVRFFASFADVMVLARELSVEQIKEIAEAIQREEIRGPSGHLVKIELFVHGAICVSISGKCYMSLAQYNKSANRGECLQACRRKYRVIDEETQDELVIDNKYVMSPKDLCTIPFLDQLLDAGISVLKIEGRGRSPEYVKTVTSVYREGVDAFSKEKVPQWLERLKTVYNRGFWEGGYYLGNKLGEWTASGGSQATQRKRYVGKVTNYFSKIGVAEVKLESGELKEKDALLITGPTTGVIEHLLSSLKLEKHPFVSFPLPQKVRRGDKLYVVEEKSCQ